MKRILGLLTVLVVVAGGMSATAAPFGAGNIVIVRVGDGTQSISNIGDKVFLDEYTTNNIWAVAGNFTAPTPVQSIQMPTNWVGRNAPLIMEGSARTDGALSLSTDGRFLLLAGFGPTIGQVITQALDSTTTTGIVGQVARVIGLVDGNGHIYTTTTPIDANENGNDIQSVVSTDGTNIWHVGEGNATGGKYTTRGSMISTQVEELSSFNSRVFGIFSNTLYYSANHVVGQATSTNVFSNPYTLTGGSSLPALLPTSFVASNFYYLAGVLGNTTTNSAAVGSPQGFALFTVNGGTSPDTLYMADTTTNAPGEPLGKAGGVLKYCYIPASNAWVNFGYIYAEGASAVTGQKNGSTVTLYITEGGGTLAVNVLYPYNDVSGFAGSPQNNPDGGDANGNSEPLSPPGVNAGLINTRGIAFTPQGGEVGTISAGVGVISVGPPFGPYFAGPQGGPFSPSNGVSFSVANLGSTTTNFTVNFPGVNWLAASPASGTLTPGQSTIVTISPNATANSKPGGFTYTGSGVFRTGGPSGTPSFSPLISLEVDAFFITPTSNYLAVGEAGGPFSPSSFTYTLTNVTPSALAWTAGISATWDTLSATGGTLAAQSSTNITVTINANANLLSLGTYNDTLVFTNVGANAALPTRAITLQVGFGFFDDFSTYASGPIDGQNNWYNPTPGLDDNPYEIVNGVLALSGGQHTNCSGGASEQEPAKNIASSPVTNSGQFAYLGMTIVVTNAPSAPNTWDFTLLPGVPGANVTFNEARTAVNDNGSGHYVWNTHINGFDSFYHGTTARSYNTPYNVIIVGDTVNSNCWVFVNPADGVTSHLFAMAYDAHDGPDVSAITSYVGPGSSGVGSIDIDNFCSGLDQPGMLISRMAFSTNYTAVYNWLVNTNPAPTDPFVTWQNQYFTSTQVTNPAYGGPNADPFGKGMSNTNQFLAGFNPTNAAAYLHIISIAKTNSDVSVTYLGASGNSSTTPAMASRTNVLEFTAGTGGNYSSNGFASAGVTDILSGGIGLGTVTNMVDPGGATNIPARYYRVRVLVP